MFMCSSCNAAFELKVCCYHKQQS